MKEVEEFCSICQLKLKMLIVQEANPESEMIWVKCPKCNEIKPLQLADVQELTEPGPQDSAQGNGAELLEGQSGDRPGGKDAFELYNPESDYEPGQTIYHKLWDDLGEVVEKQASGSGRRYIVVEFKKQGRRKLLVGLQNQVLR